MLVVLLRRLSWYSACHWWLLTIIDLLPQLGVGLLLVGEVHWYMLAVVWILTPVLTLSCVLYPTGVL